MGECSPLPLSITCGGLGRPYRDAIAPRAFIERTAERARTAVRQTKDLRVAASSLLPVHAPLIDHLRRGVVTRLETYHVSGPVADAISRCPLAIPVVVQTHGGSTGDIQTAAGGGSLAVDNPFAGACGAAASSAASPQEASLNTIVSCLHGASSDRSSTFSASNGPPSSGAGRIVGTLQCSASPYASPHASGALFDLRDVMVLGAAELDLDFKVSGSTRSIRAEAATSARPSRCRTCIPRLLRHRRSSHHGLVYL